MIFVRQRGGPSGPALATRILLFFIAAALWFGGVALDALWLTGLAIIVAGGGIIVGIIGRRAAARSAAEFDTEAPERSEGPEVDRRRR